MERVTFVGGPKAGEIPNRELDRYLVGGERLDQDPKVRGVNAAVEGKELKYIQTHDIGSKPLEFDVPSIPMTEIASVLEEQHRVFLFELVSTDSEGAKIRLTPGNGMGVILDEEDEA